MTMLRFRGGEEEEEAQKKKKAAITNYRFREEEETLTSVHLRVRINEVIGCDQGCSDFDPLRPNTNNKGKNNNNNNTYYVTLWVDPDEVYQTPWVSPKKLQNGSSYLTWCNPATRYSEAILPEIFLIELNPEIYQSEELKLEVIRTECYGEVGTSNGNVVVGRATIKMSKVSKEMRQSHSVDLTRTMVESLECRIEGKIIMDMKVDVITRPVRSWYW